jgi:beta-carotene 15,15'-dioxygenase
VALVVLVIIVSSVFSLTIGLDSASWQIWLAVVALAIGVPHGALDHLVTVPAMQLSKLAVFVATYLAVTGVVMLIILRWPVEGFIFVVLMSAVHFGMGDASFITQESSGADASRLPWWVYAAPAGALPVVIPLTNTQSSAALALVNSELLNWHFGAANFFFWIVITISIVAIFWLISNNQMSDARDLLVLGLLALLTPPLVAFAAYFGLWHAMRHTARLSAEIPAAAKLAERGSWIKALWRVTLPGVPALIGTMLAAGLITALGGWQLTDYLWIALVVIWALTVPHMALTWRLDQKILLSGKKLEVTQSRQ